MEIEISQKTLSWLLSILAIVIFSIIGVIVSPRKEDGTPMVLSPELARINQYVDDAANWAADMRQTEKELSRLLAVTSNDIFSQTKDANQVYGDMQRVQSQIDQSRIPPTLEGLHELLVQTSVAHIEAVRAITIVINEPSDLRKNEAASLLEIAIANLNRVYTNPWLSEDRGTSIDVTVPTLIPSPTVTLTPTPVPTFTPIPTPTLSETEIAEITETAIMQETINVQMTQTATVATATTKP